MSEPRAGKVAARLARRDDRARAARRHQRARHDLRRQGDAVDRHRRVASPACATRAATWSPRRSTRCTSSRRSISARSCVCRRRSTSSAAPRWRSACASRPRTRRTGARRYTTKAYLTFVAIDERRQAAPDPAARARERRRSPPRRRRRSAPRRAAGVARSPRLNYVQPMPVRASLLARQPSSSVAHRQDRVRFLHGMVSNDIEALATGQGCHAAMLTTKGKLLADFVVFADARAAAPRARRRAAREDPRAPRQAHRHGRRRARGRGDAPRSASTATTRRRRWRARSGSTPRGSRAYRRTSRRRRCVSRTPELGVRRLPRSSARADVAGTPLGDAEFEERRIEAGTPRYGVDMGEDRLPIEAGINDAVSFTKGCYLGQEVIARATNLGHINRRLVGLVARRRPAGGRREAVVGDEARGGLHHLVGALAPPRRDVALGYVIARCWRSRHPAHVADGGTATVAALPFAVGTSRSALSAYNWHARRSRARALRRRGARRHDMR